jgi:hypothetical protein
VSTHGLNTQRVSAVQKAWSSYVYATILLQHGPTATSLLTLSGSQSRVLPLCKVSVSPGLWCLPAFPPGRKEMEVKLQALGVQWSEFGERESWCEDVTEMCAGTLVPAMSGCVCDISVSSTVSTSTCFTAAT